MTPTHLVVIDVPRDESMDRMLKRAKIEERPDDDPEIMKQRLDIYENETLPVIDEYQSIGVLKTVNGLGTVEQVARRVEEVIK